MPWKAKTTETEQSSSKVRKTQTWETRETWTEEMLSLPLPSGHKSSSIRSNQRVFEKTMGSQTPKMEIWNDGSIPLQHSPGAPADNGWRPWHRSDRGGPLTDHLSGHPEIGWSTWHHGAAREKDGRFGMLWRWLMDTPSQNLSQVTQHAANLINLRVNQAESSFTPGRSEWFSPTLTVVQQHHFTSPLQPKKRILNAWNVDFPHLFPQGFVWK